ncbi:MAG: hypothetical protein AAF492_09825, partial [Verrucomicrobiota bacterium]
AKLRVTNWGGDFHVVYLPARPRLTRGQIYEHAEVLVMFEQLGIHVIDLVEAFETHERPRALFGPSPQSGYTDEGFRLVAEELERALAGD